MKNIYTGQTTGFDLNMSILTHRASKRNYFLSFFPLIRSAHPLFFSHACNRFMQFLYLNMLKAILNTI